jgi:hypothetical protein
MTAQRRPSEILPNGTRDPTETRVAWHRTPAAAAAGNEAAWKTHSQISVAMMHDAQNT